MKDLGKSKSPFLFTTSSDIPKGQKTPRIGISQIHKKQYPMNLTLYHPQSPIVAKKVKEYENVPDFIDEYMSNMNKSKFSAESKIINKNTFYSTFRNTSYLNDPYYKDLHPPISLVIPPISYGEVKSAKNCEITQVEDLKIYQPNTIHFSPRSKMVIYAHAPIYYNVPIEKPAQTRKKNLPADIAQYRLSHLGERRLENLKFSENLKKLKEIIKDPLIYEQ